MQPRPNLTSNLNPKLFEKNYYLKEELVNFCRKNDLQTTGAKAELNARIIRFLENGEKEKTTIHAKKPIIPKIITSSTIIEKNFICSEKHRAFFESQIGKSFTFNVAFQKWLKENPGKTYQDSIDAYYQIKKNPKTVLSKQFEYNIYIRDFFAKNHGKTLTDAIKCWNYKKNRPGSHKYEKADLVALK